MPATRSPCRPSASRELEAAEEIILAVTDGGFGKRSLGLRLPGHRPRRAGARRHACSVPARAARSSRPSRCGQGDDIMLVTDRGQLIRPAGGPGAHDAPRSLGVMLIRLDQGERVNSCFPVGRRPGRRGDEAGTNGLAQTGALARPSRRPAGRKPSMPERVGLYPGTFDPVTNGHLDMIGRARRHPRQAWSWAWRSTPARARCSRSRSGWSWCAPKTDVIAARTGTVDRGPALRGAAGRLRAGECGASDDHPRPARGDRFRLRVPDGRHEPPPGSRDRDGLPDGRAETTSSSPRAW